MKKETIDQFREEAKEWLSPLGYSIHCSAADGMILTFTQTRDIDGGYPAITCKIESDDQKSCQVSTTNGFKMFLYMQSGWLAFKHPDIQRYINLLKHYSNICERYSPSKF